MSLILHITSRSQWQDAQKAGVYHVTSLASEGFIHCSAPSQIVWVANTFYQGQTDLVLLCIAPEKLTAELRYEEVEEGKQFPHLYGALNLDAVVQVIAFAPQPEGNFVLPKSLAV